MSKYCSFCGYQYGSKYEHNCNRNTPVGFCADCGEYGGSEYPCKCYDSYGKEKNGCFITTATLKNKNINDDKCYELETFRNFRDTYINKVEPILIEEYYSVAPRIVEMINQLSNKREIYIEIWNNYLATCLKLIENKEFNKAKDLYKKMVDDLKQYIETKI